MGAVEISSCEELQNKIGAPSIDTCFDQGSTVGRNSYVNESAPEAEVVANLSFLIQLYA